MIADAGGVIGVWTKLSDSMGEYVAGIKALVDNVGIDHVGIGSDTDILSPRAGQSTNAAWPGLSGGFFKAAVAEMLRQGFTPGEIGKIGGGNFCRVFDEVTTGHACPSGNARAANSSLLPSQCSPSTAWLRRPCNKLQLRPE